MEEPPLRGVPPPSVSQCLALVLCDVIDAFCRGEVIQSFSCKLRAGSAMSHVISRGPIELLDVGFMRMDHFRNDVINRQEYYVIPDMLAKNVGRSVSIIANEQRNGFGSSDFAAAEVCKRGRVTGHSSALNSPAT